MRIRRALLSVTDKRGIVDFAKGLAELGMEIVSTGGTARSWRGGRGPRDQDFTGFPEMMDGRVKTLHPKLYAGLLARRDDPAHVERGGGARTSSSSTWCASTSIRSSAARVVASKTREVIENIDIGGPTMIRARPRTTPSRGGGRAESYDAVLEDARH